MRIPISTKLISVTILILVAATGTITYISSAYFEKRSSEQVDIANLESASGKAKEIENIITSMMDKTRLSGSILLQGITNNPEALHSFDENFNKDKNFISLEVLKLEGSAVTSVATRAKKEILEKYKISETYFQNVRTWQKFQLVSVTQGSFEISNGSYASGPPMFTVGIPLIRDDQGRISHIAIANIDLGILQKIFSEPSERTQFIIDKHGEVLAHKNENYALRKQAFVKTPIIEKAMLQKSPQFQTKFTDPRDKKTYFGAAVKTSVGATLISQTSEESILEVSREVRRRSIFVAGSAISLAIFFIFLFSMTLTGPIERLASLIKLVSKGNFDVKALSIVKSHDEVGDLAKAFDEMTDGLKERDKVKSLFSKFHGSSVTDDLINKDIGLGGQQKDVCVFFSDIRGFTAFSEHRTPEEVVSMLNEYFGVMVGIINKYGGVVDKFIGDAIMAVWGAPKETEYDCMNAVRACLEMRIGLEQLNQRRIARGEPPIAIGMGLHSGFAISGTIGSDERMEYTIIGNTVNTASRIEASTKAFGSDLLITDEVLAKVGDNYNVIYAGAAEVKGRTDPIKMYKVRGYKDQTTGEFVDITTQWSDYEAEKADKVKISA